MNDIEFFTETYKTAAERVAAALETHAPTFVASTFPKNDVLRKVMTAFVTKGGKRLRPALSLVVAQNYGQDDVFPHLAVEVFHKYLLTHDDVIDRDDMRYGVPTIHAAMAGAHGAHFGNAQAIIAGDLLEAATHTIIAATKLPDASKNTLHRLAAKADEAASWGWYDQFLMDYMRLDSPELTFERIEQAMVWVTGKYSILFPLQFGFAVAQTAPPADLERFADTLGVLFQVGDDLIGLFGEPGTTGKSNSSDIAQGKKTVPLWFAYAMANDTDKATLRGLCGNAELTSSQAQQVRAIVKNSGAFDRTKQLLADYAAQCDAQLDALKMPPDLTQFLRGLVAFLQARDF
ncbi:MAG TPA: polyprenyl synthetase family protein [Candidatus Saccharimonas sp.]|nr:polyprenyl synthetase family protein [Candidatus Saccharimonas sp.]